jgi:carbon-monoxide dehydrogenase large subunit
MAHARITGIDSSGAIGMPGVAGVFTAADLGLAPNGAEGGAPRSSPDRSSRPTRCGSSVSRWRWSWPTPGSGRRRGRAVLVDYDPLPVVVDPPAARSRTAPRSYSPDHGSNVAVATTNRATLARSRAPRSW